MLMSSCRSRAGCILIFRLQSKSSNPEDPARRLSLEPLPQVCDTGCMKVNAGGVDKSRDGDAAASWQPGRVELWAYVWSCEIPDLCQQASWCWEQAEHYLPNLTSPEPRLHLTISWISSQLPAKREEFCPYSRSRQHVHNTMKAPYPRGNTASPRFGGIRWKSSCLWSSHLHKRTLSFSVAVSYTFMLFFSIRQAAGNIKKIRLKESDIWPIPKGRSCELWCSSSKSPHGGLGSAYKKFFCSISRFPGKPFIRTLKESTA